MNKKIALTSIIVTLISLAGKILGFFRETLLANYFGTSYIVDAYLMSVYIPSILFGWLPAISAGYVPKYYEAKERERFTNNALCWTMLIAMVAILTAIIFNNQIVRVVAPGFSKERYEMTSFFFYITVWTILFNTPIRILTAYLNCNEGFIQSSISGLFLSAIQAIFIVVAAKKGIVLLPLGILTASVVQFFFLIACCVRKKYKCRWELRVDEDIISLLKIIIPIFLSYCLEDINSFVDKFLASGLGEGTVAGLNYAFTLKSFFFLVFTTAITTITYPKLSSLVAEGKETGRYIGNTLIIIIVIFLPLTAGALVLAEPLVKCVFMHGAFDAESLNFTVGPYVMYVWSLLFLALRDFFIKILYAYKDSRSNLIAGVVSIFINIVLSLIFVGKMGTKGLALATSLACVISIPIYICQIAKKKIGIGVNNILVWCIKSIIASSVMVAIIQILQREQLSIYTSMSGEFYLKTIGIIIIAIVIYFCVMIIENLPMVLSYLKNKKYKK